MSLLEVLERTQVIERPQVIEADGDTSPAYDEEQGYDRCTHIILEGIDTDEGEFIPAGPTVVEGIVMGTPVEALCGKRWVPNRNPKKYPLCGSCKDIAEGRGWRVPAM